MKTKCRIKYESPMVSDFEVVAEKGFELSSLMTELEDLDNTKEEGEW